MNKNNVSQLQKNNNSIGAGSFLSIIGVIGTVVIVSVVVDKKLTKKVKGIEQIKGVSIKPKQN